ncbi:uncharacterized protein ACBR49_000588 [Aulostomus maculatus]
MYHHQSQQQGPPPFSNGPRPAHHQQPQNQQQNRSASDMLSGFQFPRPTQLPEELESALAIRGARDMDHRLIDHMNQTNLHQNQGSGSGISQHGSYSSNSITLTSDNQVGHPQGVDWTNYQPPTKLFSSPPSSASHQSQQHHGPQQQAQSSHAGTSIPSWGTSANSLPAQQSRHPHSGSGEGKGMYTPESAGSILASFGLSNEDLEVLSHYPDDQLTPDTLPFILRDIQINKSGNQKTVASTPSSSFSRNTHDVLPSSSHSQEVPSLLTVTQTAGKVIDYGHASRAKEENSTRETFKREPLSSERTVKIYPSASSSSASKLDKAERRQVRLEHMESSKHGDRDYRRTSSDHHKSNRSPGREVTPSSKPRNLDRDYRYEGSKPRPSSETRSEASSRRSLSSSSGTKPHSSSKMFPTPTMISDFSALLPKVYPHTCSLCHIQCDHEKDWVEHINTVNHTAACRELRNKYPDWKPNLPSGRYGSRLKNHPPSHSVSPSLSCSPPRSSPHSKYREGTRAHRPHRRPYPPPHRPRYHHYSGGSSPHGLKRPHVDLNKHSPDTSGYPSTLRHGECSKHGPQQSSTKTVKSGTKPGTKAIKIGSAKAADTAAKPLPPKKKKKIVTASSCDSPIAGRLVYLTGIPTNASEEEVTDLVGSFGKINNVILMPCSDEESGKGKGQKASVCMVKAEDAQALATSTNLSIREQQITASVAKIPEAEKSPVAYNNKPPGPDTHVSGENSGGDTDMRTSDEKGVVLITGLPESSWSENDIIRLVQPFGTPSDIIRARAPSVGKVLVSVPDMETAEEMVKVHTFIPAKINDCELKMIHLKQRIGLNTPVALYNLLMGSLEPLESPAPVGWSSLLMISNVPDAPNSYSEVQKLVRRFGTVIKTLVLNNMVICEMATAAMALSVYKRFQKFPCIIQNNPLYFSRKPDPKANTLTKVIAAYLDSSEDKHTNNKDSKIAGAKDAEEMAHEENSASPLEGTEKDGNVKMVNTVKIEETGKMEGIENMEDIEEIVCEDEMLGKSQSTDDKVENYKVAPEADVATDIKETSVAEAVIQTFEDVFETENVENSAREETLKGTAVLEFPKVTQEMVNALLVECRTRTVAHPDKTVDITRGHPSETQMETEGDEKNANETKEQAIKYTAKEPKNQEKERKEKEVRKEKEAKERERKEREKRAWEKEHRTRKEREREERTRRDRERREWEKERERRERKRAYGDDYLGTRLSYRAETYKQGCWKDAWNKDTQVDQMKMMDVEEEFDEFPFNLSDFVTVDEVGDVTELRGTEFPQSSSAAPMETTGGEDNKPTSLQQDTQEDTPMEITTATMMADTTMTPGKSDGHLELDPHPSATAVTSESTVSSDWTGCPVPMDPAPQAASPSNQTHGLPPDTEPTLKVTIFTSGVEPLPIHAPATPGSTLETAPTVSYSESCTTDIGTEESETIEKELRNSNSSHAKEEQVILVTLNKVKEQEKMQSTEDKDIRAQAAKPGMDEMSENHTKIEEKRIRTTLNNPSSTNDTLPPFDPSNPVGMEFLAPKTGFFCKVCNRFFSGDKEAEINHCKTLKHYENLKKYLQTQKNAKPSPSRLLL